MDRLVYVVSDLHLGPGRLPDGTLDPLEDFTGGPDFAAFLDRVGAAREPAELVIAGDFLEYCQTLPEIGLQSPADHLGSSEAESLLRTQVIMGLRPEISSGHPEVFQAMRRFMANGHSITVIAGNHDIDLLWGEVWALLWDTVYPPGAWGELRLCEYSHTVGQAGRGRVHIEHGHEHDPANRFGDRMTQPFALDGTGMRRLKRCWGTLFVDKVYNQLEQERWFIDNVKPIPRVVKLGLRNDFRFTATAMGLVARFLLTSGLPPGLGASAGVLGGAAGAGSPEPEQVAAAVADPELRAILEQALADPASHDELATALGGISPQEWAAVSSGAPQLTLDGLDVALGGGEVVLGGGGPPDAYREAARSVMESDPRVETVILGHTHGPIDGFVDPVDLADGRQGYYFNSGTWTRHLRDEGRRPYTWQEIGDAANYTASYTYVKLTPDQDGAYRPSLGSWARREIQ